MMNYLKEDYYTPGEIIIRQKDFNNLFYGVIVEGTAEVSYQKYTSIGTFNTNLLDLSKNMSFGQVSFFSGFPPNSTVKCKNHCTVLKILRTDFLKILKEYP